jgi:hypothetical protein
MRRWQRLGISKHSVIEFNGKPITRILDGSHARGLLRPMIP